MAEPLDLDVIAFQSAVAGQYSREREPARGGMGIVRLAREAQPERAGALEMLSPMLAARADMPLGTAAR